MRSMVGIAVGALALSGLAACGGGEESLRTAMRTQGIANCQRGTTPDIAAQVREMGTTVAELCTCAIDRYLRATSFEQLKADRNKADPPGLRNAIMQCAAEQVQRRGAAASNATGAAPVDPTAELGRAQAELNGAVDQAQSELENARAEIEKSAGQ